jgi:hypothetical protein
MNVPVPKIDASRNPVMPARSANYRKSTTE